jgi:hypothetical protein
MKSHLVLKEFVDGVVTQTIIELAKQPHEAEASGFALSIMKSGTTTRLVLYQPTKLQQICQEMAKQPEHLRFDAKLDAVLYMLDNPVVGFIRINSEECGLILLNSAAIKGYGPMMYDITLAYAGKTGIIPDRQSVSPAARNIWKYYATKRQKEIKIFPISEDDECATHQNDEDYWCLDARYVLRNPDLSKITNLTAKGEQTFQVIQQTTSIPPDEVLRRLASSFFDQMYPT